MGAAGGGSGGETSAAAGVKVGEGEGDGVGVGVGEGVGEGIGEGAAAALPVLVAGGNWTVVGTSPDAPAVMTPLQQEPKQSPQRMQDGLHNVWSRFSKVAPCVVLQAGEWTRRQVSGASCASHSYQRPKDLARAAMAVLGSRAGHHAGMYAYTEKVYAPPGEDTVAGGVGELQVQRRRRQRAGLPHSAIRVLHR